MCAYTFAHIWMTVVASRVKLVQTESCLADRGHNSQILFIYHQAIVNDREQVQIFVFWKSMFARW